MKIKIFIVILITLNLLSCSSSYNSATNSKTNRYLITLGEIQSSSALNARVLIQDLRSFWLKPSGTRGQKSLNHNDVSSHPIVYVNGIHSGTSEELMNISAVNIIEIKYLDAGTATIRYGSDHASGAILITTHFK